MSNTFTTAANAKALTAPITVLLVDDSPLIRMSLRVALPLESNGRLSIVGEAENGLEALALGKALSPQAILMDVGMPQMDGIEATQRWQQQGLGGCIIMLTSHDREADVVDAFRAGATSYCLKETEPKELAAIVQQTVEGASWIDPKIARFVLNHLMAQSREALPSLPQYLQQPAHKGAKAGQSSSQSSNQHSGQRFEEPSCGELKRPANDEGLGWVQLSQRELEVLALMCRSESNGSISNNLCISANTVKTHIKNIYQKLGVDDRTSAVLLALKEGLLPQI